MGANLAIPYSTLLPDIEPSYGGGTVWARRPSKTSGENDGLELKIKSERARLLRNQARFLVTGSSILPPEVSVEINGAYQFLEAQRVPLVQYWKYETLVPAERMETKSYPLRRYSRPGSITRCVTPRAFQGTIALLVRGG